MRGQLHGILSHPAKGVNAGWYEAGKLEPGPIGLISHSGSLFLSLAANDPRVTYSLFVSPGQELVVTAADFMHYMLEDEATERSRCSWRPCAILQGFTAALEKANARDIPVVAIKVGKRPRRRGLPSAIPAPSPATMRPMRRCSRNTGSCGHERWTS